MADNKTAGLDESDTRPAAEVEPAILQQIEDEKAGLRTLSIRMWLPGLILLAGLLFAVSRFAELEHFMELAAKADLRWLLLGVLAQALTYVCAAGVWWLALGNAGHRIDLWLIVPLGVGKLFADQALPTGGASGTLLVTAGLLNRKIPLRIAFFAMLVGLLSYYSAYLSAALISLFVLFTNHRLGTAIASLFALFALVAILVPLAVLTMKIWGARHIPDWVRRFKSARIILLEMAEAPLREYLDVRLFTGAFLFQMAIFGLDGATLWLGFKSIGQDVPLQIAFTALVAGSIGATIGPVPLGLGTFEGSAVGILVLFGIQVEPALTAVLLLRGLSFWLPMLPGLWFARRELNRRSTAWSSP